MIMKVLRIFSRILIGVVFIYSGFVKIVDPLGSTYKFIDYFNDAFHLPFLEPTAFPLAIIMAAAELLIGIALLFGFRMKISAWAVLGFMSFFTPLTLYLAIANPVHDCGCFGDALILTNWETFWKNVIIMAFVLVIFLQRKKYPEIYGKIEEWIIVSLFAIATIWLSIYCYNHLPVMDYRPYHVGMDIQKGMEIPADAPVDEYETTFFYKNKNTGTIEEFNSENYPWQDTVNYEFSDSKSVLIKKGYTPPIHDFSITTKEGEDITDIVLDDEGYTFLLVSYNLEEANTDKAPHLNDIYAFCKSKGYKFYGMTASVSDVVNEYKENTKAQYEFCTADEITLKTIVRANPGLVLLKKGTVLDKWHYNDLPSIDYLSGNLMAKSLDKYHSNYERKIWRNYALWIGLIALLYIVVRRRFYK